MPPESTTEPYTHDDGTPWTGDELAAELRARDLPVSGTVAEKRDRLEADDRDGEQLDAKPGPAEDQAAEPEADNNVGVAEQWAVYMRPDGSQYMVCTADVSAIPEDQRPLTEPERPDDRRAAPTATP